MTSRHTPLERLAPDVPLTIILSHWFVASAVFYLFVSSWWMLSLPLPSSDFTYRVLPFQLHKNIGITMFLILIAMVARYLWLFASSSSSMTARLGHGLFYLVLILCCLTGYLSSSFSGWNTTLWWIIDLPQWAAEDDELNELFSDLHLWLCWILLTLIAMHIAAAMHHILLDDGVADEMLRLSKQKLDYSDKARL